MNVAFRLSWSARHVGLDAEALGGDPRLACWTLIRSVMASEFGRMLPAAAAGGPWEKIAPEDAQDFDLLVFGYGGMDTHVGLVVADSAGRRMLHLPERWEGECEPRSIIEPYDCDPWQNVLKGVYRLGDVSHAASRSTTTAVLDAKGDPTNGNLLIGRPFITEGEEKELFVEPGLSIAEMVEKLYPAAAGGQLDRMRVRIAGGAVIERESWWIVPAAGAVVTIEPLPGVFGLRSWLQIGVAIAAIAASVAIGNPWLGVAASAAITVGGNLAINLLLPPAASKHDGSEQSPTYSIQGWQNVANPNGAIPALLGAHRVAPVKWAQTFSRYVASPIGLTYKGTWATATVYAVNDSVRNMVGGHWVYYGCIVGHSSGASTQPGVGASWQTRWQVVVYSADQWNYALLCGGYGPQTVNNLRIGDHAVYKPASDWADPDVPESNFGDDIEIEIREGYPSDAPVTLYPEQVFEDVLRIELPNGRDVTVTPTVRRTLIDITRAELDFFFPEGLFEIDHLGGNQQQSLTITIRYRAVGNVGWSAPITLAWEVKRTEPFGHTETIVLPVRGPAYDIEVVRTASSGDDVDDIIVDRVDWISLKSFRPEYPVVFDKPLVLIAIKVRASNQLAGQLANLNYDGALICKDWDSGIAEWTMRETTNPAALIRWLLQGPAKAEPEPDSALNFARLQYWHEYCSAHALRYSYVHDTFTDFEQALAQVASNGNAQVWHDGSKWDVIIDEPQTVVSGLVTLRNGFEIKSSRPREKLPDALLVPFRNRLDDYAEAERVVPFPGAVRYSTRAALYVDLSWPDGTKGEVWETPASTAHDGVYIKSGAAGVGSWSRISLDLIERWERPGLTHPNEVWKAARHEQWERKLRRRRFSAGLDGFDAMTIRPGNMLRLDRGGRASGRVSFLVKSVTDQGGSATVWTDEEITQEAGVDYELRWRALPEAVDESVDDPPSLSIVRPVITSAGRSRSVIIENDGILPSPDDLAVFGPAGGTGIEAIVAGIDIGDRSRATVELFDHAPEIATLVGNDDPPPFSGRVGEVT